MTRSAWADPRIDGDGHWRRTAPHVSTRRKWLVTFVVCFLFVGALWLSQLAFRPLMSKTHANSLSYCPGFTTTTSTETAR